MAKTVGKMAHKDIDRIETDALCEDCGLRGSRFQVKGTLIPKGIESALMCEPCLWDRLGFRKRRSFPPVVGYKKKDVN